jgi:hypothetical protein
MPILTEEPPYAILGTYLFYGEEFLIDEEEDQLIIHHPRWSLAGSGKTLHEAEHDLAMRAKILLHAYTGIPENELSSEAQQMIGFLQKIA